MNREIDKMNKEDRIWEMCGKFQNRIKLPCTKVRYKNCSTHFQTSLSIIKLLLDCSLTTSI